MKIERVTAKGMLILDAFMDEPYFAPYGAFGMYQMGIDETAANAEAALSGQTGLGTILTAGLLVQMNWLEDDVSRSSWLDTGIENTYIDLYVNQYGKAGPDDPNLSTGMNWGAGLRLEF